MTRRLRIDQWTWIVREGCEPIIHGEPFDRLRAGRMPDGAVVVRDNIIRSSLLVPTDDAAHPVVFIKRYKPGGLRNRLKYLLLPSKARAEWGTLRLFESRGIACPRALAYGERRNCGMLADSLLVTESLHPSPSLHDFLRDTASGPAERRRLTRSLAQLAAMLHRQRIYYRDLHAGNILIRTAGPAAGTVVCVDLHRAFALPVLFEWMAVNDLAQLCNSLPASRADRLRFLIAYCDARFGGTGACALMGRKIEVRRHVLEARRIHSRSKRCVKNSTVFEVMRGLREHYCGRRDFGYAAACRAIALHRAQAGTVVKQASKSVLTVHEDDARMPLCVKGCRPRGLLYNLAHAFSPSRAMKSWRAAHGLLVRGFDTPQPLALSERRAGLLVREAYYIARWLPDALELNTYVQRAGFGPRKREFIRALAHMVRRLHEQGVYHADLKSNNILVAPDGDGWRFFLVDLDRVHFDARLTFSRRANNLAQINASVADVMTVRDRLQFFREYAKGTALWRARRRCYRAILAISRRKNTAPYGIRFSGTH